MSLTREIFFLSRIQWNQKTFLNKKYPVKKIFTGNWRKIDFHFSPMCTMCPWHERHFSRKTFGLSLFLHAKVVCCKKWTLKNGICKLKRFVSWPLLDIWFNVFRHLSTLFFFRNTYFAYSLRYRFLKVRKSQKQITLFLLLQENERKYSALKYLSPFGATIKHHNQATFMNQKVVTQNFIIEPT